MNEKERLEVNMVMDLKIFGDLKVVEFTEMGWWSCKSKDKTDYRWYPAIICKCTACGKEDVKIKAVDLLTEKKTHCGCKSDISKLKGTTTAEKIKYVLDNRFGKLKPVSYRYIEDTDVVPNKRHRITCECSCGNTVEVNMYNLISGIARTCGCGKDETRAKLARMKNLSYLGKTINGWTINDLTTDGKENFFTCKCKCGNIRSVNVFNIINNKSKDCGCGRKGKLSNIMSVSETGNRYGTVVVGDIYGKNNHEKTLYTCSCECGRENVVLNVASLKNSNNPSCGCLSRSTGEKVIFDFLLKHNIDFQLEATFENLEYDGNKLRFDFYLKDYNLCIEFDGLQHYTGMSGRGRIKEEHLEYIKVRDKTKDKFCEDNRIDLLRIPYYDFDKIEIILSNKLGI